MRRWPSLLLAALLGLAGGPVAAAEAPDFASPGAVRDSLEAMIETLESVPPDDPSYWRVLRGRGQCDFALKQVEDFKTVGAYDAAVGRRNWERCAAVLRKVGLE